MKLGRVVLFGLALCAAHHNCTASVQFGQNRKISHFRPSMTSSSLHVSDLPPDLPEDVFALVFGNCGGYVSSRLRRGKGGKMIGFVDFESEEAARAALEKYQGFRFKTDDPLPIRIEYSRSNRGPPAQKRRREEAYGYGGGDMGGHSGPPAEYAPPPPVGAGGPADLGDPAPTLFVEGLPRDVTTRELSHIFRPFEGYQWVRLIPADHSRKFPLCFVEFDSPGSAGGAVAVLQGYQFDEQIPHSNLRITFAKPARGGGRGGGGGPPPPRYDAPYGVGGPPPPPPAPPGY